MTDHSFLSSLLRWFFAGFVLLNLSLPVFAAGEIWHQSQATPPTAPAGYVVPENIYFHPNLSEAHKTTIAGVLYTLQLPYTELGSVTISPVPPGNPGCAYTDTGSRTIYLGERCSTNLTQVVVHELGHIVDAALLTPAQRTDYCARRGIDNCDAWYAATYASASGNDDAAWLRSPAEDFAEEFVRRYLDSDYPNHTAFAATTVGADFWTNLFPTL